MERCELALRAETVQKHIFTSTAGSHYVRDTYCVLLLFLLFKASSLGASTHSLPHLLSFDVGSLAAAE